MLQALADDLSEAMADVSGFMLLKIDLPDLYEAAIVTTEVTNQEIETYTITRTVNETQQQTVNIQASGYAKINVINSNATSQAARRLNVGAGIVAQQNIEYVTLALKDVNDKLAFAQPKSSLLDYFFYQKLNALKDDTANKLLVGVSNTTLIN